MTPDFKDFLKANRIPSIPPEAVRRKHTPGKRKDGWYSAICLIGFGHEDSGVTDLSKKGSKFMILNMVIKEKIKLSSNHP